jgi:cupin 2 domain-containing protein
VEVVNLLSLAEGLLEKERVETLLAMPFMRLEHIASKGHTSPPGFWYDQAWDEWVVLLTGSAALLFEQEMYET